MGRDSLHLSWAQPKPRELATSPKPLKTVTPTIKPLREDSRLSNLVKEAFKVLNATNPKATESCWLCYNMAPPYYEGIAFTRTVNQTEDIHQCRWQQGQNVRLTLSAVTGQGTCIGKIPPSQKFLCNQTLPTPLDRGYLLPPTEGWWACSSGLTPCVNLQVLRDTQDFCVLVQLFPRLIYHPYEELLSHWDSGSLRTKREPIGIMLSTLLGLGLRAEGAAMEASALVIRDQNFRSLQAAIDANIQELENYLRASGISDLLVGNSTPKQERPCSLVPPARRPLCGLQRRMLLLYRPFGGNKRPHGKGQRRTSRKKEREQHQGWFESRFNSSPWLTTLISVITGPLVILLLLLTLGPCMLNRLLTFIRERISTVHVMMLRQQYQGLSQNEV